MSSSQGKGPAESDAIGYITRAQYPTYGVTVTIANYAREFFFSPAICHVHGMKPDAAILEKGMKVNVSYEQDPERRYYVTAVWLGDKPPKTVPRAIFGGKGHVTDVHMDCILIKCDESQKTVLLNKMFTSEPLHPRVGDSVSFDAIPQKGTLQLRGTCGWTGSQEPSSVKRFGLDVETVSIASSRVDCGVVSGVANDDVFFVDVEGIDDWVTVWRRTCHFRNEYQPKVGDPVCLRLGEARSVDGWRQAFATEVWREGYELSQKPLVDPSEVMKTLHIKDSFTSSSLVLFDDPSLQGMITRKSFDSACVVYEQLNIFTDRTAVFINKKPCSLEDFELILRERKMVNFEAVIMDEASAGGRKRGGCTHEATCVWIGEKPSLKDVADSSLVTNPFMLRDPDRKFCGIVTKFYLPKMALILVKEESTTVCLDASKLKGQSKRLDEFSSGKAFVTDLVLLGTSVTFNVGMSPDGSMLEAIDVAIQEKAMPLRRKLKSGGHYECIANNKLKTVSEPKREGVVHAKSPLYKRWPTERRRYLLDFNGVLHFESGTDEGRGWQVECDVGRSACVHKPVVYGFNDDQPLATGRQEGIPVRFDAEIKEGGGFDVTRMWAPGSDRPPAELILMGDVGFAKGSKTILRVKYYDGVIKSIPFHDCALATLNDSLVLVPLDSLYIRKYNPCYDTIDMYLKEGDDVSFKMGEWSRNGLGLLKAVDCFLLEKFTRQGSAENEYIFTSRTKSSSEGMWGFDTRSDVFKTGKSWDDQWGVGEFYRTSTLVRKGPRYAVEFESSRRQGMSFKLDLLGHSDASFFLDGVRTDPNNHARLDGRQVTYHVRHIYRDRLTTSSYGMRLACSWIGREPSPWTLLHEQLVVPKGLVCSGSTYECVLNYFELPCHAIVNIGLVPAMLSFEAIYEKGAFVRANTDFHSKDLLLVQVDQVSVGDDTYLVASKPQKNYAWNGILRDVTGTVLVLPEPVGIIKVENTEITVSFETCHVHDCAPPLRDWCANGYLAQIEQLRDMIRVGTRVRLSAYKSNGQTAPYRSIEIRLLEDTDT